MKARRAYGQWRASAQAAAPVAEHRRLRDIVRGTNVLLSGMRSRNVVLRGMLTGAVPFAASPAIILEYEDLLKRPGIFGRHARYAVSEIDEVLDAVCAMAVPVLPWFRFRPMLADPNDDFYVECALAGGADTIITSDRGFRHPALSAFGIRSMLPREFIEQEGHLQ
jgi:predicted nucleic acid-binding protein